MKNKVLLMKLNQKTHFYPEIRVLNNYLEPLDFFIITEVYHNTILTISLLVPTRIGMPQVPAPDETITWGLAASFW